MFEVVLDGLYTPSLSAGRAGEVMDMECLIDILESFNRKERFYLLTYALGQLPDHGEPKIELGKRLWDDLKGKLCLPTPKGKVFVAMDYHLNWIHASLYAASSSGCVPSCIPNGNCLIENNQQDVDLLIAFETDDGKYHLIFVEAKGYNSSGYARFEKNELIPKFNRLKAILNCHECRQFPKVKSYFCLMSRQEYEGVDGLRNQISSSDLEISAKWIELPLPKNKRVVKSLNDDCPRITKICT